MATRRYKRDFKELETRRRRGMRMLARGVAQAEVARACAVSRQTASSWAQLLAEDAQAWRRRPLGRPGAMSTAERAKLGKLLLAGAVANGFATELWTLARIAKLIKREFGHAFSTVHVWRVVRELGFSSQRPAGRALQRDEAAIGNWKTKRWPVLKKTPESTGGPSSSSTNRD
jgi:putative transposase